MKPRAGVVDAGAAKALMRGSSLLPAGVTDCERPVRRGDPLEIADEGPQFWAGPDAL